MTSQQNYPSVTGFKEALNIRKSETNDIVVRAGVISPDRIILHNYPMANPVTAFNAGLSYMPKEDVLRLYPRIILGYYMYVSYIAELSVPLNDLFSSYINTNRYSGDIVVYPSTKYDIWGTEDPRVYELYGDLYMTYTGRTIYYFNPKVYKGRTLPVTAVFDKEAKSWVKKFVFVLDTNKFPELISNKDAFLHKTGNNDVYLFHRPHFIGNRFYMFISRVNRDELINGGNTVKEITVDNALKVLEPASFESKLGWASTPIDIGNNKTIVFVHAVDKEEVIYRVFALQLKLNKEEIIIEAITPKYIMEPRYHYEIAGDRPLTIFPCGSVKMGTDTIIMSYGASDSMIGLAMISLNELLGELDKGRIY